MQKIYGRLDERTSVSGRPDESFVQEVLAQLPWYHQLARPNKLPALNPPLVWRQGHRAQLVAYVQ